MRHFSAPFFRSVFACLIIMVAFWQPAGAISTHTVGTATGSSNLNGPTSSSTQSSLVHRHAAIYTVAELNAASVPGGGTGKIISIAWDKTGDGNYTNGDLKVEVWMNHTTLTNYAANPTWATITTAAGATKVANITNGTMAAATGFWTTDFNLGAFTWNGTQNVEVMVQITRTVNWGSTTFNWRNLAAGTSGVVANAASAAGTATLTRGTTRPQVQFTAATIGNDAAITAIPNPNANVPGNYNIDVTVRNTGTNTITGAAIDWRVNGGAYTTYTSGALSIATGASSTLTVTNYAFPLGFADIEVLVNSVNGGADANTSNDGLDKNVLFCGALSGAYTINKNNPTAGTNFNSLNDFSYFLTNCGVGGAVTATVTSGTGPYNEQVIFTNIPGIGAANTVTLNGNGETISFPVISAGSDRHIIRLTDLSYFTVTGVHIVADPSLPTNFYPIHIFNSGSNITISNNTVDLTGGGGNNVAIVASGSLTSFLTVGTFSNLTIDGNTTIGGGYGVDIYGSSGGTVISNNNISGTANNSIYIHTNTGTIVRNNTINFSASNGIQLAGTANVNCLVEKNWVSCTNPTNSASIFRGIYVFGNAPATPNRVANNVVWNMNAPLAVVIGISGPNSGTGAEFYFNTVILNDATATGNRAAAFSEDAGNSASILRNNIFYVTRPAANYSAGIVLSSTSTTATAINSNFNAIYAGNGALVAARANGTATNPPTESFADIASWRTASGEDLNSYETDPFFESNVLPKPTTGVINNLGTPITGITNDITNAAGNRTTTPDIGAYEFVPPPNDAAITDFVETLPTCSSIPVIFTLTNAGTDPLNDIDIEWFLNGVSQGTQHFATLALAPGASTNLTLLASQALAANTYYDFEATATNPNFSTDANALNNTYTHNNIRTGFSGSSYTINSGLPGNAINYTLFQSLVNDLVTYGVCGPVSVAVTSSGPVYAEQVTITSVPGASNTNRITINGNNQVLQFNQTSGTAERGTITFNGGSYFTFDNLQIKALGTTYGWGVRLYNTATGNTFNNCRIESDITQTGLGNTGGIIASASATTYNSSGLNSNNTSVTNCTIVGGYVGISIVQQFAGPNSTNNLIQNNTFIDQYNGAILLWYTDGTIIRGNTVYRQNRTNSGSPFSAIYVDFGNPNVTVEKNIIRDLRGAIIAATTYTAYGIRIGQSADGTAGNPQKIFNNLIYNLQSNAAETGIEGLADYANYYHNTFVSDDANAGTGTTVGFNSSNSMTNVNLKNNIFFITRASTGTKTGIKLSTGTTLGFDNNDVYLTGSGNLFYGTYNSIDYTTRSAFNSATGLEANSLEKNPVFTNPVAGNYIPQSSDLNNVGANVGVTDDIVSSSRNVSTPDIGAYEFNLPPNDAGVTAISPAVPYCPGTLQVVATVKNFGSSPLTSVTVNWNFNGVPQTPVNATGLNVPSNGTTTIVLGSKAFTSGTTYNMNATTSLPNGASDAITTNDLFTAPASKPALSGVYTVNDGAVASPTNYISFSTLAADLGALGVCGPVTVNVSAGPYTEQVTFPVIPGTSAVNTVTINGNDRRLQYGAGTTTARHTLLFNGADYVKIDNLTIASTAPAAGFGFAVHMMNESNNNSFTNDSIISDLVGTSAANFVGILINGTTSLTTVSGKNANNTLIENNIIVGGSNGISILSEDNTLATGNIIRNNTIRDFYAHGIYIANQNGAIVSSNDISRPTRTTTTTLYGIRFQGQDSKNNLFEKNRIHNLFDAIATSTTHTGMYIFGVDAPTGQENKVINNLLYNFNNIGAQVGFENAGSDGVYYYHNTISLDHTGSATTTARGFYQTTAASNIRFYNNIVTVSRPGTGTKHGIYLNTVGSSVASQYNNIYVSGTNANVGRYNSIDYSSGPAWSGAGYDNINSKFADPVYLDAANGNFKPTAGTMNGIAINTVGVPTDIMGITRSLTAPDPGAYEYSPCFVGLWTGDVDDNWFTPGNWCFTTVPTSATNVIVPDVSSASNNYPVIEGLTPAVANGLEILANAKITMVVTAGNTPTLEIYGSVDNSGSPNFGTGNITFKGTTQALLGPVQINGIVSVPTGTTLTTNGNLTIQSGGQLLHGTGTPGGGGNVSNHPISIRRTGVSAPNLWNYWGSPVAGANASILGGRPHYYDPLSATDPNTTGGLQAGWKSASGVMNRGTGYISTGAATVTFTGTVNDLNTNPTLTAPIDAGIVPYNLLGNPFPSAMDATAFMAVNGPAVPFGGNGTITGTMWFWDDDGSGGLGYQKTDFAAWSGAGGVAGPNNPSKTPNGHVATAQGFQVEKTTSGPGTVAFNNPMRSANNLVFFRQKPIERLWVNVTNSHGLYNEVLIAFIDDATDGYDAGYDAKKMRGNPNIALYTKLSGKDYMIQAFSPIVTEKVVELGLDAGLTGSYTFNLKAMENLDETVVPMLEDRLTGTWQNLRTNPSYTFDVTTRGVISERFYIHFNAPMQVSSTEESCLGADAQVVINQPGDYYWGFILADSQGNVVANDNAFTGSVVLENLKSGDYTLLLSDRDGYQITKNITVSGKQKVTADFETQSNIVLVDEELAFVNHSNGATTYEWDFGDGTTVSGVENPSHTYTEAGTYTVRLLATNSECYHNRYATVEVTKLSTGIGGANSGLNVYSYGKKIFAKLNLNEEKARMLVYDVVGKEVYSKDISTKGSYEVDMSRQPDNSYFVVIRTATETYRVKVMLSGNN